MSVVLNMCTYYLNKCGLIGVRYVYYIRLYTIINHLYMHYYNNHSRYP